MIRLPSRSSLTPSPFEPTRTLAAPGSEMKSIPTALVVTGPTVTPVTTNAVGIDFISLPGAASVRVGSNGDGVSDDLEGNLIINGTGSRFVAASSGVPAVNRRNRMMNNAYRSLANDLTLSPPTLSTITNNLLSGTMTAPAGPYTAAFIDLYTVDPVALARRDYFPVPIVHPLRWLGTFTDNGAGDLDPASNQFAFDLSSFGLAD